MMDCLKATKGVMMVRGVDLSPTRSDIEKCSLDDIPFEDGAFNSIMFNAVIEHLDEKLLYDSLKEMHRVLKDNGYIIITTAYKEDLVQSIVECPRCAERFHRWGHVMSYDESVMVNTISPVFEIIKLYHTSLGFLNAHPRLRYALPLINFMGFLRGDEYLICIARKTVHNKDWLYEQI